MINNCPGSSGIKGTPSLKIKLCPQCGKELEVFSNEKQVLCSCGFVGYNDTISCISWCKYARECVGDEIYEQFAGKEKTLREDV